jgi:small subunit ribosomal protein SAe
MQVDLFFYREPEESKDHDEEEGAAPEFAAVEYTAPALGLPADAEWGPEAAQASQWEGDAAAAPAAAPAAEWAAPSAVPAAGWDVGAPAPAGWDTAAAPAAAPAAPAGWEPAAL